MKEITITYFSQCRLKSSVSKAKEISQIIDVLTDIENNETASALIAEQRLKYNYQVGYILGILKGNFDILPDEMVAQQEIDGESLDKIIKNKVNEYVLDVHLASRNRNYNVNDLIKETDYKKEYRWLCEYVCGYGYSMSFAQDRFEQIFPNGMNQFVLGFAEGYSAAFHKDTRLSVVTPHNKTCTDPKTQDIWKNWEYFFKRDVLEYRLDGEYIFMYHGGGNCSNDPNVPYKDNRHHVNIDVYELFKKRPSDGPFEEFISFEF